MKFWNDKTEEPIRWGWLSAVVLGAWMGLAFTQCGRDNRPEAFQDGGEPGPTGRVLSSLGRVEGTDRPGFIIATGKLSETHDFHQAVWNVGGVTLLVAPNQLPADLRLRELDGRVIDLIIREAK